MTANIIINRKKKRTKKRLSTKKNFFSCFFHIIKVTANLLGCFPGDLS